METAVKVNYQVGSITSNLEEVAAAVRAAAEEYKGIVITPDAVAEGKKTIARLRKEKTELDNDRKKIKKAWMAPFEAWEAEAKKVIALYDEPEAALKSQLDAYEADRIAAKQERIKDIWAEVAGNMKEYIPLARIYQTRWENATCSEDAIREEIETEKWQIGVVIDTIHSLKNKYEPDGLEVLKRTGDMQAAISKMTEMTEQEIRIKEEQAAREEQAAKEDPEQLEEVPFVLDEENTKDDVFLVTVEASAAELPDLLDLLMRYGYEAEITTKGGD